MKKSKVKVDQLMDALDEYVDSRLKERVNVQVPRVRVGKFEDFHDIIYRNPSRYALESLLEEIFEGE